MQTVNFNCPHCGKLMAVGLNLLGRNVRCPHCKQVVQAPATAGPPPAPTLPEPSFDLPTTPKESHESIFGEVHDDDVFGAKQPKVQLPAEPPAPSRTGQNEPTLEVPPPPSYYPPPTPAPPRSMPLPEPAPVFNTGANPWDVPGPVVVETPLPVSTPVPENQRLPEPSRYARREPVREGGGGGVLVWILLLYSAAATGGAAYLFFNRSTGDQQAPKEPAGSGQHPYTAIPDFFGEYGKAQRKQAVRLEGMPPPNLDLPDELTLRLNDTIMVNDLEITAKSIEYRPVTRHIKKIGSDRFDKRPTDPIYLLKLHIKNRSNDVVLHPTDPAFNAVYPPDGRRRITPYGGIVVGKERFAAGPFFWPDSQYERQYVDGQETDEQPLGPGEERDYVIASDLNGILIRRELHKLKPEEAAVWRVQLRTGLIPCKDGNSTRDVSVTSVIGVYFSAIEVETN